MGVSYGASAQTRWRVLAVDPGKVSGFALWADDGEEGFTSGEYDHFAMLDYAATIIPSLDVVVCESYIITAGTLRKERGENWSLEAIGVLRWLAYRARVAFVLQTPADAKTFATDAKLERMTWKNSSRGGHRNDAARHLVLYLTRSHLLDPRRLASPSPI